MKKFIFLFCGSALALSTAAQTKTDTIRFPSGEKYYGDVKGGIIQGNGTMIWNDGGKYEGQWKNNHPDGKGTMTW
ncbi:MAG TPA: hypothetical protein VI112_02635, partial [Bacteroidia bacterium]